MHKAVTFGAALLLSLGLGACGGSSEGSDAPLALQDQLEAICQEARAALEARGEFPVEDFDPENPRPADLPSVGAYFAAAREPQEAALESLRGLDPPPASRAKLNDLIEALRMQLVSSSEQVEAALNGDARGFTATLENASTAIEAVRSAADALGSPGCNI